MNLRVPHPWFVRVGSYDLKSQNFRSSLFYSQRPLRPQRTLRYSYLPSFSQNTPIPRQSRNPNSSQNVKGIPTKPPRSSPPTAPPLPPPPSAPPHPLPTHPPSTKISPVESSPKLSQSLPQSLKTPAVLPKTPPPPPHPPHSTRKAKPLPFSSPPEPAANTETSAWKPSQNPAAEVSPNPGSPP